MYHFSAILFLLLLRRRPQNVWFLTNSVLRILDIAYMAFCARTGEPFLAFKCVSFLTLGSLDSSS